jgi:hypothetical protein
MSSGIVVLGIVVVSIALYLYLRPLPKGNAHGISLFCPIKRTSDGGEACASIVRRRLQMLGVNEESPFARVPDTYLCRGYVLNDVFYEGGEEEVDEHLASRYLVFTANYYGDLDTYLQGMWDHASKEIRFVWEHCVGFDGVADARSFKEYVARCQVRTTFFFNGSDDAPLEDQLKALHLKQELSRFVFANQGVGGRELQSAFAELLARVRPIDPYPRWASGSPFGRVVQGPEAADRAAS